MAPDAPPDTKPESFSELQKHADELQKSIEELRKKNAMPINSSLGSPKIDAENADGRHDLPPDDDEN
jgi:hypothetical protein